jgi:hypothetical protein
MRAPASDYEGPYWTKILTHKFVTQLDGFATQLSHVATQLSHVAIQLDDLQLNSVTW